VTETQTVSEGTRPQIERHPLFEGVRIVDPIERSQFSLLTPSSVDPTRYPDESFYFPVDTTARIHTSAASGDLLAQSSEADGVSMSAGSYNLELTSAQMKLYLAVDGAPTIEHGEDRTRVSFEETQAVTVGVRSFHEQPAATVTVTDDPVDVMAGISTFGSALKTTTCERSFPTLRGHPPLLERGDERSIPDSLDRPETGVEVEVPPELSYVYPVASLSYYLGATVRPGSKPRLIAGDESFPLTADADFESTVARILKQVFLLDCVTRTEGYYTVDLHERSVVEESVDLNFEALYDRSLAEQLRAYLSVPYEAVESAMPRWKLTADVIADPKHLETLPFLATDLAVIRCPSCSEIESRSVHSGKTTVADFFGDSTRASRTRSESEAANHFDEQVFRPPPADSIEQTYVGDGIPLGASKMNVEAYRRRLAYEPAEDAQTSIVVVSNEDEMNEENVVSDIYGTREWLEFDITIRENLTTEQMADVLATDADFLHYIGHVDPEGIRCADGWLDVDSIERCEIKSFLLNACSSYEQGRKLIEAGAIGGIATVTDVLNGPATEMGRTLARLLDTGFSLFSALEVLETDNLLANHYLVVGDGNTQICKSRSGAPPFGKISTNEGESVCEMHYYPAGKYSLGSIARPQVESITEHFLNSGSLGTILRGRNTILKFLSLQNFPVTIDGSLYWSQQVSEKEL